MNTNPVVKVLIYCQCGQKNRLVVGTVAKCGACKRQLSGFSVPTLDNMPDRLRLADAVMAFGRMNAPQDYQVCGGCGCTFHVRDGADHDACNPATPKPTRAPDPVDLMMAGRYVEAIAAYRAIVNESGDPLGVCESQIRFCETQIAAGRGAR